MNITDIRVRRVNASDKMKAVVSVTFDNAFVVHDMKIIERDSGLFVAMPSRKTPSGVYKDVAHPINAETRKELHTKILERYFALLENEEEDGYGEENAW